MHHRALLLVPLLAVACGGASVPSAVTEPAVAQSATMAPTSTAPAQLNAPRGDPAEDPQFAVLSAQIEGITAIPTRRPDWQQIATVGDAFLGKWKDARVAIWVAVAKLHVRGWRGLAEGLAAVRRVAPDDASDVYPAGERRFMGRANLLTWLGDQTMEYLGATKPAAEDKPSIAECLRLIHETDAAVLTQLSHDGKAVRGQLEAFEQYLRVRSG